VFETTNRLLQIAEKNRTLVVLWGALVACLAYSINQSADLTEKMATLRDTAATIEGLQAEQEHSREMVKLWKKSLRDLADRAETYSASLTPDRLSPSNIRETAERTIDENRSDRRIVSVAMGKINNFYFSLPSDQELERNYWPIWRAPTR
jgi:hypothetical protein